MTERSKGQDWEHKIGNATRKLSEEDKRTMVELVRNLSTVDQGSTEQPDDELDILESND